MPLLGQRLQAAFFSVQAIYVRASWAKQGLVLAVGQMIFGEQAGGRALSRLPAPFTLEPVRILPIFRDARTD